MASGMKECWILLLAAYSNKFISWCRALFLITESAKSNQLKPYNYLVHILKEMANTDLVNNPELIDQFLPWSKTLSPDCYKTS